MEKSTVAQEKEQTLKLLGFSPIQARVYLTLVKSGRLSAKTLAKYSNVARPDIYRIMNNFQKLGIAQKIITNPVMFEATPIKHSLSTLMEHKVKEVKQTQKKTKILIMELQQKQYLNTNFPETQNNLFLIPATKAALEKRKELIQKAQFKIDVISSWQHYKYLLNSNFNEQTKIAIKRNVKYRIILETPKKARLPCEHHEALKILEKNNSTLRYTLAEPSAIMSLYDNREMLLMMSPNEGPFVSPVLWSNNDSIVSIGNSYFDSLWKTAYIQPP